LRKRILVSVDAGETRVAVQEAKGSPARRRRRPAADRAARGGGAEQAARFDVSELYVERRSSRSIVGNI